MRLERTDDREFRLTHYLKECPGKHKNRYCKCHRTTHGGTMTVIAESFPQALQNAGLNLRRRSLKTLQVNLGAVCDLACRHCHVESSPTRKEAMSSDTVQSILKALDQAQDEGLGIETLDLTGGAPEMHPQFRSLVQEGRRRGLHVMDRSNLTVFFEKGQEDTPAFLADHEVEIIASLPCYTRANVDHQRGPGVYDLSMKALKRLNALGYGSAGSPLILNLVYNPGGAVLPGAQADLEADYKRILGSEQGIVFHHLYTLTNLPIGRFAGDLARSGKSGEYQELLVRSFNPEAAQEVMCRDLVSVGWDGSIYDCDFNQMIKLPSPERNSSLRSEAGGGMGGGGLISPNIRSTPLSSLLKAPIATGSHCFGCTAGAGSSCGGALVKN